MQHLIEQSLMKGELWSFRQFKTPFRSEEKEKDLGKQVLEESKETNKV